MKRILCLGDSITDCGRLFENAPLGNGYVRFLSDRLQKAHMEHEIINCGTDGFTVSRLLSGADRMYLSVQADVITILIGINDIGLMMNTQRTRQQQEKMMTDFFTSYRELIQKLNAPGRKIILIGPFLFPKPEEYLTWFPYVRAMAEGIASLALEKHLLFLPLHDVLNEAGRKLGMDQITTDGIHLTERGQKILSDLLYPML